MAIYTLQSYVERTLKCDESYMDRIIPISLWDKTAKERDITSVELPQRSVDLVVVGGGYTGLSTALHSAQKGLEVHVLEANHIGYGGSGRNVGLVNAGTWLSPTKVRKILGTAHADMFIRRFSDSPSLVFELIKKYQIQCELTKTGTIHAAHSPKGLRDLEMRFEEWQRLGEPVELLSKQETAKLVGTDIFYGGLHDHRAGTINPMGYCRGLARAAIAAGAGITTGIQVTGLDRQNDHWIITTSGGMLQAKAVVLGTNAYTDDLWPGLKKVFTTIHYVQFATKPLGDEVTNILPGRQGLWDTGQIMFNVRKDAFNRLLVGTMGRVVGSIDKGITRRWAQTRILKTFPELGDTGFEEAWHGKIAMTPNHLPSIHELAPNLWTAIGYNGRGITTGTLFGIVISNLLTDSDSSNIPLPITKPKSARLAGVTTQFYDMAFTAKQLWNSF